MTFFRHFSLLVVPFLGGCGLGDSQPSPVNYSPGFFATFDHMVDSTMAQQGLPDAKATTFTSEFVSRVEQGPNADEVHAVGSTWDKVRSFLDIGLISSDIMATVNDSAQSRVDIFADASDRVLRSDYLAITSWNQSVSTAEQMLPTADIVWESLYLVLTESAHAQRKVQTAKGTWVDGYWMRIAEFKRDLWVNDYYQTIWKEPTCYDEYVKTDCISYWVEETCTDVWIDDGYWESTCTGYDENDSCVEWTDVWVSTGYYETQCVAGHYEEQCTDIYQTVCNPGHWDDILIGAHPVRGAPIPGELAWVLPHEAQAAGERIEVLPEQEAAILGLGIEYVLSFGPAYVQGSCRTQLEAAHLAYAEQTPEKSITTSRQAILHCLSKH